MAIASVPASRRAGLPALLMLAGLCLLPGGCGGPDTAPMLAECARNTAVAKSAIDGGQWNVAIGNATGAYYALGGDLTLVAADQQTLAVHKARVQDELAGALRARLASLGDNADRASLSAVDNLVTAIGDAALGLEWKTGARAVAETRLAAAEAAAKAAAERQAEADRRVGYVLIFNSEASKSPLVTGFVDDVVKLLAARLAPVPVTRSATRAAAGSRIGGLITLELSWESVSYGGPTDVFGKDVPVALGVTVTLAGKGATTSLDGIHALNVRKDTPQQVSLFEVSGLHDRQTKELFGLALADLGKLPVITDGEAKAQALREAALLPPPPAWRLITTWKGVSPTPMIPSYSYADAFPVLTDAISRKLAGAALEPEGAAPAGTVSLTLVVQEATFGSGAKSSLRTVNGNLPTAMVLQVTIVPAGGAARTVRLATASAGPQQVAKEGIAEVSVRERRRLLAELAAAIAASAEIAP